MNSDFKEVVVGMHQPNYLPWLGFFHKITYSDVFIFMDDVQFPKKTVCSRCYLEQKDEQIRLSIPVKLSRHDLKINEVMIDTTNFADKHLKTIHHIYNKSPYYESVMALIEPFLHVGEIDIASFNMQIICAISNYIGLETNFIKLSNFNIKTKKNQLLIDATNEVGGTIFASGNGAQGYIGGHEEMYIEHGVKLAFQNFVHNEYPQYRKPFVPNCSIVDLLFNVPRNEVKNFLENPIEAPPYLLWKR